MDENLVTAAEIPLIRISARSTPLEEDASLPSFRKSVEGPLRRNWPPGS
jgi:hypothetical protein